MKQKIAYKAVIIMLIALSVTTSAIAAPQTSVAIASSGNISYWPRVDVTIKPSQVIGVNNLSLGVMLDFEWKTWLDRSVLKGLTQDVGFKLVRIFDFRKTTPRLSPCVYWNESSKSGTWDWTYVDLLVQRIFEVGAEPLFCLGWARDDIQNYIPTGMAVNPNTGLPYPDSWAAYCREWVKHFKNVGLPVRFYETMNEPWMYFGWDNYAKLANFMAVFNAAAQAMREENPNVLVSFDGTNRKPVLDYWLANYGADLGFISFHKYDSGVIDQYSDSVMLNRAESFQLKTSVSYYGVADARRIYYNARGKWIPVINSESNFNSAYETGTDPKIQQLVGSVWLALTLRTGILEGLNYNVYFHFGSSASWEQTNKPSGGVGFGMVNLDNNKPWYPYYVQKMIGNNLSIGDLIIESSSSSSDVLVLSWIHNGKLEILLVCKTDQNRAVYLKGIEGKVNIAKIDNAISWGNPMLQFDEINSDEPVVLRGYTVALLTLSA